MGLVWFLSSSSSCRWRKLQWCLYVGRWVLTSLGDFQFQDSGCSFEILSIYYLYGFEQVERTNQHSKASYPRTLQHDEGVGWTKDLAILVAVITGPSNTGPRCWQWALGFQSFVSPAPVRCCYDHCAEVKDNVGSWQLRVRFKASPFAIRTFQLRVASENSKVFGIFVALFTGEINIFFM